MVASVEGHDARIARVEGEVQSIRQAVGGLETTVTSLAGDVRALGGILGRIEEAVARAQDRSEEREIAGKPNLIAVISILITIITIIVGGAWLIGGQLARLDERSVWAQRQIDRTEDRFWEGQREESRDARQAPAPR